MFPPIYHVPFDFVEREAFAAVQHADCRATGNLDCVGLPFRIKSVRQLVAERDRKLSGAGASQET